MSESQSAALESLRKLTTQMDAIDAEIMGHKSDVKSLRERRKKLERQLREQIQNGPETTLFDGPRDPLDKSLAEALEGVSPKVVEMLAEAGLTTVRELATYTNSGRTLTQIAGIGEGKAETIRASLEQFWAKVSGNQLMVLSDQEGGD